MLDHRYIMKAYELYIDEFRSQAFYIMEFLSYPNLTRWMAKNENPSGEPPYKWVIVLFLN